MTARAQRGNRVWVYQDAWRHLGDRRFEIEWITVKPEAIGKTEIDPDFDSVFNCEYWPTLEDATARAKEIFAAADNLMWGVVTVQEQVVDWFVEEDRIGGWENIGNSIEVDEP